MIKQFYVILTPFFPSEENFTGPFVYDQVKAIQDESDFDVIVIKTTNSGSNQSYNYNGIQVHQIKLLDIPSFLLPGLFSKVNVAKLTRKLIELTSNKLDSIKFIHGHVTYPFGVLAVQLAKKIGAEAIVQHHGFDVMGYTNGRFQSKWIRSINKYWINQFHVPLLNQANWNIGVSQKTLDELNAIPGYKPTQEYVLYNGINTKKFYPIADQKDLGKFTIGCVANFWHIKDQITLIKAVNELIKGKYNSIQVFFIGTGVTLSSCQEFVIENHLQENIFFLDTVQHHELLHFYNTLDLFVLPSYWEAFGCVYLEAHACGVPFIAVKDQGISEIVKNENIERQLINRSNVEELQEQILYYFENRTFFPDIRIDYSIDYLIGSFLKEINNKYTNS
jgi:glycosyltransferase involved in cell wall biosynthesis